MAYEQVQKPSSSKVPVKTKVSELAPSASRVQAKDVTAGEQEQIPKVSTPATDANWLMKHPLFKGNQFLQREVAPQSESESLESEEETLQRQEAGKEAATPYSLPVQAKLTIGAPGDKYEQEADRVASQVVKQINSPEAASSSQGQSVQRMEEPVEELQRQPSISDLQRTPLPLEVQRVGMPAEEELQAKSILQGREAIAVGEATNDLDSAINSARGGGQFLDAGLQRSMGQAMGADFSGVKVHTDAKSDQLNQSIQAKAFTTGQDVFFRQGAYDPGSRGGQELIAHELTHVVQQNGGAVQRSLFKAQQPPSLPARNEGIRDLEIQAKQENTALQRAEEQTTQNYKKDDVSRLNQYDWGVCGFVAAYQAAISKEEKTQPGKRIDKELILDMVLRFNDKLNSEQKASEIWQTILNFSKTFTDDETTYDYNGFLQALNYMIEDIDRNPEDREDPVKTKANIDVGIGLAMPPVAMIELLKNEGITATIKEVDESCTVSQVPNNTIIGLGNQDNKEKDYKGLLHWVFKNEKGEVMSWGEVLEDPESVFIEQGLNRVTEYLEIE